MKKIVAVVLSFMMTAFLLVGCGNGTKENQEGEGLGVARTIAQIKDSGFIKIGVFSDKKPFSYVDENRTYQGYDVYFGNRIAKDLDVNVEYVPVEAERRVEYLKTGKVDIMLANFTVTEERAEQVDFSLPYMKVALGVVSPDSNLIKEVGELNNRVLIVTKGTTAETYFTENYPKVKLLKFDQYSEAFNALLEGMGVALSTDNTEVLAWALENKGFTVGIEGLGDIDMIAPAVQKDNSEMLGWLNNEIKSLEGEQFFHKNYEETLKPIYGDSVNVENVVVEGGVVK